MNNRITPMNKMVVISGWDKGVMYSICVGDVSWAKTRLADSDAYKGPLFIDDVPYIPIIVWSNK